MFKMVEISKINFNQNKFIVSKSKRWLKDNKKSVCRGILNTFRYFSHFVKFYSLASNKKQSEIISTKNWIIRKICILAVKKFINTICIFCTRKIKNVDFAIVTKILS